MDFKYNNELCDRVINQARNHMTHDEIKLMDKKLKELVQYLAFDNFKERVYAERVLEMGYIASMCNKY